MKKKPALLIAFVMLLCLFAAACGEKNSYDITVLVPSGEGTVTGYSEEDIMSESGTITIKVPAGIPDGSLRLVSATNPTGSSNSIAGQYVTSGTGTVKFEVKKGSWYKIAFDTQGSADSFFNYTFTAVGVEERYSTYRLDGDDA